MRRYWTYQFSGWLAYSAVGITINLINGRESIGPLLIAHVLLISCGIGLTHWLRHELHRRRRPDQPVTRLWPFLAAGSVAIAATLTALIIAVNLLLGQSRWDAVSVAALGWGMWLAVGVWIVLYVRFSDQRRHEAREGQLQLALREAQLRALEAQINPHFLFNSLNSIRALVEFDPPRAQDMLTRLSNVLRNSLRLESAHTVPLRTELEAVSDYLALETVRFGDRLHSAVHIEPAAAECLIPPMILQTLVENAIKHGIGRTKGPGDLIVQAAIRDQVLWLTVENTGQLQHSPGSGAQLGLKNIRERLHLLYGEQGRLGLEAEGQRVKATIMIPVLG